MTVLSCLFWMVLAQVETGLDRLVKDDFGPLKGRSVAFLINHSAVDGQGRHLTELLKGRKDFEVKAFLAPEHGFRGHLEQEHIAHATEKQSGVVIYSLYGDHRKPTAEMLAEVDLLVFDIQDIGTRFYTYQTTLRYAMEACAENGVSLMLLDRPNPIGGVICDGPVLDSDKLSFVGSFPMPVIHGMTLGEMAHMFRGELGLTLSLQVMAMKGWRREMRFDGTGLPWIDPSPNIRNLNQAVLYPAIGMLEATNLSVGRGTDTPFQWFGAPWLDGIGFCRELNGSNLPGLGFVPHSLTPDKGPFAGHRCDGVQIFLKQENRFDPILTSYAIFRLLLKRHGDVYQPEKYMRLMGNHKTYTALLGSQPLASVRKANEEARDRFAKLRQKYLLY